uniref:Bm10874 n=1 Tax=Brugia malayi TaxID=6279 RepID=A0A0H5SAQ4_BRUMA|nr:Bm10874 [Brugia malayi]
MDIIELKETNESGRIKAFLDAAYRADYEAISDNLAHGLSADIMDDDNTTALQIASAQGNLAMMQILLNRGASVDKCNHCGFTPLLHAARNGKVQAIELLIRHGANPFRTTFYGTTALSLASSRGHLNVLVMLREYASETRRRAPTPLIAAIATKQYQIVIHLEFAGFIRHPCCDVFYELDAFHVAEQLMDLKMIALLHDLDLQLLNQPAVYCITSRTFTNRESQVEIPRKTADIRCLIRDHKVALVDYIMNLNDYAELPTGTTPLMYAAIVGSISMVQILLQHNCNINASYYGFTPIMIAIVCGNDALTQYLVKKGASQSTNGCQFSLFELASNSDGISSSTIQMLLKGSGHKMRLIKRMAATLQKISRIRGKSQSMCHQPIKLVIGASQQSFLQKVVQNMGMKSNWVPKELFSALAWPDSPCTCFEVSGTPNGFKTNPKPVLEERIMVNTDEQEQCRCLMNDCCLRKRTTKDGSLAQSSNFHTTPSLVNTNYLHIRQQQCNSISKLQSILFHFGSGSPKNYSMTSSSSSNLSMILKTDGCQDSEVPMIESISELCSTYKYENKYWDLLNRRCSPDMCQKLEEQEIDYETFLLLTRAEFISLGINRSDAAILSTIQKILKEELSKI